MLSSGSRARRLPHRGATVCIVMPTVCVVIGFANEFCRFCLSFAHFLVNPPHMRAPQEKLISPVRKIQPHHSTSQCLAPSQEDLHRKLSAQHSAGAAMDSFCVGGTPVRAQGYPHILSSCLKPIVHERKQNDST